jgi:HAMP domain-containing protein
MRLSLYARMALILLAGLLSAQLASLWLHWDERSGHGHANPRAASGRPHCRSHPDAGSAPRATPARPPRLQSDDLRISAIRPNRYRRTRRAASSRASAARLGSEREVRSPGGMAAVAGVEWWRKRQWKSRASQMRVSTCASTMASGSESASHAKAKPRPPCLSTFFVHLLISLVIVTGVVMLAVRQATRPLQQLAQAADSLGRDLDAPPLAEEGPTETRQAAQAFNRMQQSIRRLVDERARALWPPSRTICARR